MAVCSREALEERSRLQEADIKTGRAWSLKENFRHFGDRLDKDPPGMTFRSRYRWATRGQIKPMIEVAKMLKKPFEGLMNYIEHRITNAMSEGLNSRIQSVKIAARGFRNFDNYRTRVLFFCGKLALSFENPLP